MSMAIPGADLKYASRDVTVVRGGAGDKPFWGEKPACIHFITCREDALPITHQQKEFHLGRQ